MKKLFMGIELDVLIGHDDHDLMFIATQVAKASGLKDPAGATNLHRAKGVRGITLSRLMAQKAISLPTDSRGKLMRSTTVLFNEPEVYAMLLRGHAPASEPFRKWVTGEVLPSIRKTGRYDARESINPIAQGVLDELKALRKIAAYSASF